MITDKIKAVNRLYGQSDRHVSAFKRRACLACEQGCGDCCRKEDLHATILEFLPAAHHLYLSDSYQTVLDRIQQREDTTCVFYDPYGKEGHCSMYQERGLICRLFGFSATTDKKGDKKLVACKKIKEMLVDCAPGAVQQHAPNMSSYYLRLYGIDPDLSMKYFPVNQAIKKAIETVVFYFDLRKEPAELGEMV